MKNKIKVVELFAGVGGFRIGLERVNEKLKKNIYNVVWSNQWEPSTKIQYASLLYEKKWGKNNHSNINIEDVKTNDIPDFDLLVGGFPCQDYSVATSLKNSKGLQGKKGVLWWSIYRILLEKVKKPKYLILENVDRLLKSPSKQRGRDFAVMLKCLDDLGYAVEWRVINAAEYGFPQRRRRVFFIGYHKTSSLYKKIKNNNFRNWILKDGVLAKSFSLTEDVLLEKTIELEENISSISASFGLDEKLSFFQNSGIIKNGIVYTAKVKPDFKGKKAKLKNVLVNEKNVPEEYYIDEKDLKKWQHLKGAKKDVRVSSSGFEYNYSEGKMIFPDSLEEPSRTIITGEGGSSPSRFKHVVSTSKGLRRLMPIELERLNMFPDNHTYMEGISDTKRAFLMGNALVIGIVDRIAEVLQIEV